MKNPTKFNWACAHCGKRNIDMFRVQFDIPQYYECEMRCTKCGRFTKIGFNFSAKFMK